MQFITDFLRQRGLDHPDRRPLHAYEIEPDEHARLGSQLVRLIQSGQRLPGTAQAFVLWASERIRTQYPGGHLTWEFVFKGLEISPPKHDLIAELTESGLSRWKRPVRQDDAGRQHFLFSLLAEGGVPDQALREGRYRECLLDLIAEIEAEGVAGQIVARSAARRVVEKLPQALRHDEQEWLLADLAMALTQLREALPAESLPEAVVPWLDRHRPDWRRQLPIRLSPDVLESLIRPALGAERRTAQHHAIVRRELRWDEARGIWVGAAEIVEGAILPFELIPKGDRQQRLRLRSSNGAVFLAQPEAQGWRLIHQSGFARFALKPDDAVVLSAFCDGSPLGEVVVDAGLPEPADSPSLWREDGPEVLSLMSGRGQTRAERLWVLLPKTLRPTSSEGLRIGEPKPGPGGWLWPVSGHGRLIAEPHQLSLSTGAAEEAPVVRLVPLGELLQSFESESGTPIYLGKPDFFGAEGAAALRRLTGKIRLKVLPRTLGGKMAEWVEGGTVLQRMKIIVLSDDLSLRLTESGAGAVTLEGEGLERGWQIRLQAAERGVETRVTDHGKVKLRLEVPGQPGLVRLLITDPRGRAELELSALWPARTPELIDPRGERLDANRRISLGRLEGWRGFLPGKGAIALRPVHPSKLHGEKRPIRVGFGAIRGEVRVTAFAPLVAQVMALAGADGTVNCRLAFGGRETPRLEIGRYDWEIAGDGSIRHIGADAVRLIAVDLDSIRSLEMGANGLLDLSRWLGSGPERWFIQGRSESRGVMRPIFWSAQPSPPSTREERVQGHAADWSKWLDQPESPEWKRAWSLILAVREGGDAGALDQVQALGRTPAAAVFLLFFVPTQQRAAALALELEAPIWWPLVACSEWACGIRAARRHFERRFECAGFDAPADEAADMLSRIAGEIIQLRPELAAHLGHGLQAAGLKPIAWITRGETPLLPIAAVARACLEHFAQEAGRRFGCLPEGVKGLRADKLSPPKAANEINGPLLHAPLVAAEAVAGLRELRPDDILRLIALREIDPRWFDDALPAALTLALSGESR